MQKVIRTHRTKALQFCYRRGLRQIWWHFVGNNKIIKIAGVLTGKQKGEDGVIYLQVKITPEEAERLKFRSQTFWVLPAHISLRL